MQNSENRCLFMLNEYLHFIMLVVLAEISAVSINFPSKDKKSGKGHLTAQHASPISDKYEIQTLSSSGPLS